MHSSYRITHNSFVLILALCTLLCSSTASAAIATPASSRVQTNNELAVLDVRLPNGCAGLDLNDSLDILMVAKSAILADTLKLDYRINAGSLIRLEFPLPSGLSTNDTFAVRFKPSNPFITVNNAVQVFIHSPLGSVRSDDTLRIRKRNYQAHNYSGPYSQNFDQLDSLNQMTGMKWYGVSSTGVVIAVEDSLYSGYYPSNSLGVQGTASGKGKFLAFELGSYINQVDTLELSLPCVALAPNTTHFLQLASHFVPGAYRLRLRYTTDGTHWKTASAVGNVHNNPDRSSRAWNLSQFVLPPSDGSPISMKVQFYSPSLTIGALGVVSVDDIVLSTSNKDWAPQQLVKTRLSPSETTFRIVAEPVPPGAATPASLRFTTIFEPLCGGTPIVQTGVQATFSYSQSHFNFDLPLPANFGNASYSLRVIIEPNTSENQLAFNDTLYGEISRVKEIGLPYFEDFETCADGFAIEGNYRAWTNTSSASTPAFYGLRSMVLEDIVGDSSSIEYLYTPIFTGADTLGNIQLSFNYILETGTPNPSDLFAQIQFNNGSGWQALTAKNGVTSFPITGSFTPNPNGYAFTFVEVGSLPNPRLQFRFAARNCSWIIDNFRVNYPIQQDVEPISVQIGIAGLNNSNIARLQLANGGVFRLNRVDVEILDQNNSSVFQKTLRQLRIDPYQFKYVPFDSAAAFLQGLSTQPIQTFTLIANRPNNTLVSNTSNDTLQFQLQHIGPSRDSLPYCLDFESPAVNLPIGNKQNSALVDSIWLQGQPLKPQLTAIQGNSMYTYNSANYTRFGDAAFYLSPITVNDSLCYRLSFDHQFKTERNFDGGLVEFSLDTGRTWIPLGTERDSNWYNTRFVQSLGAAVPGFSGNSNGSIHSEIDFRSQTNGTVIFRFRFASDASIHDEGWVVDNICFEVKGLNCQVVDQAEYALARPAIYPNPAVDVLSIQGSIHNPIRTLKLYSANGQLLQSLDQVDEEQIDLDVSSLPNGLYQLWLETEQQVFTEKFLVKK